MHKLAVAALNDLLIDIRAELGLGTTEGDRSILDTIRTLKTQADKDSGDCAKGAGKRLHGLVEEAISWLETGGGRADSLCADLRKALAAQKQEK